MVVLRTAPTTLTDGRTRSTCSEVIQIRATEIGEGVWNDAYERAYNFTTANLETATRAFGTAFSGCWERRRRRYREKFRAREVRIWHWRVAERCDSGRDGTRRRSMDVFALVPVGKEGSSTC